MLTRYDKVVTLMVIGGAILGFLFFLPQEDSRGQQLVVVESRGEEVMTIPWEQLEAGEEIPIAGVRGDSILEMGEDKVRLIHSPCPDKICINMGWIDLPGQMIVCLPNQVVVRVEGAEENGVDAIVQ